MLLQWLAPTSDYSHIGVMGLKWYRFGVPTVLGNGVNTKTLEMIKLGRRLSNLQNPISPEKL